MTWRGQGQSALDLAQWTELESPFASENAPAAELELDMPREGAYEAVPAWRGETALELEGPYVQTFEDEAPAADFVQRTASLAKAERVRWNNGATKETAASIRDTLKGYWKAVTDDGTADIAVRDGWAWSAAFISWVMKSGGAGASFEYSSAHRVYASAAKQARQRNDTSKFWAYRVTEPQARPQLGDVIVKDREGEDGRCGGATYDNIDNGTEWNTHGDLVVDVAGSTISTIGGNLSDSVGQTPYSLDSSGLLVPLSGCKLIAVLRPPGGVGGGGSTPPSGPPNTSPPTSAHPSTGGGLRSRLAAAVRKGLIPQKVASAILGGNRSEVLLANTMFYTAHPELPAGYQIKSNETAFAQEWLRYRDVIRTLLSGA
jgi:hypothetical protein